MLEAIIQMCNRSLLTMPAGSVGQMQAANIYAVLPYFLLWLDELDGSLTPERVMRHAVQFAAELCARVERARAADYIEPIFDVAKQ